MGDQDASHLEIVFPSWNKSKTPYDKFVTYFNTTSRVDST